MKPRVEKHGNALQRGNTTSCTTAHTMRIFHPGNLKNALHFFPLLCAYTNSRDFSHYPHVSGEKNREISAENSFTCVCVRGNTWAASIDWTVNNQGTGFACGNEWGDFDWVVRAVFAEFSFLGERADGFCERMSKKEWFVNRVMNVGDI